MLGKSASCALRLKRHTRNWRHWEWGWSGFSKGFHGELGSSKLLSESKLAPCSNLPLIRVLYFAGHSLTSRQLFRPEGASTTTSRSEAALQTWQEPWAGEHESFSLQGPRSLRPLLGHPDTRVCCHATACLPLGFCSGFEHELTMAGRSNGRAGAMAETL